METLLLHIWYQLALNMNELPWYYAGNQRSALSELRSEKKRLVTVETVKH